jgi:hypothetical protein
MSQQGYMLIVAARIKALSKVTIWTGDGRNNGV